MTRSDQAEQAAADIARQYADPARTRFLDAPQRGARPHPQSLAGGAAGLALLHATHTPHDGRARTRAWLRAAASSDPLTAGPDAGLYYGVPALAFVTLIAAATDPALHRAHARLHAAAVALTRRRLDAAHARIDRHEPAPLAEFDLIRGLTGLGSYHLRADAHAPITRDVLAYLVRLTLPIPGHAHRPGWWSGQAPSGTRSPQFPGGHGNLGMAHGIAAPLALLALASLHGVTVPGQRAAITRICTVYDTCRQHDTTGSWWPGYLTPEHQDTAVLPPSHRQRPSWCYGTPGIARAQHLAGLATHDPHRQRTAEQALLGCLRDPAQLDRLSGAGLCHGLAGLLQTTRRMSHDATTPDLADALPTLTTRLLAHLPHAAADPELLDGHSGAALALHPATATGRPVPWDAFLLLA